MELKVKLFYHNYDDDEGIDSHEPVEVTCETAIERMENLPASDGNFLGLELPSGQVVQFIYDEDENMTVEIPVPDSGGIYSKTLNFFEESIDIIDNVFKGMDPMRIEGMEFDKY